MKAFILLLTFFCCGLSLQALASNDATSAVITKLNGQGDIWIIQGKQRRRAQLFSVVPAGAQIEIDDAQTQITLRHGGEDIELNQQMGVYTVSAEHSAPSLSDNLLDWALAALGAGDDSTNGENSLNLEVAAASRGTSSNWVTALSPFRNRISARSELVLLHSHDLPVTAALLRNDDDDIALAVKEVHAGVSQIALTDIALGEYEFEVCSNSNCQYGTLTIEDPLTGELPAQYSQSQNLIDALALIRDNGEYQLEGLQIIYTQRQDNELARWLISHLMGNSEQP